MWIILWIISYPHKYDPYYYYITKAFIYYFIDMRHTSKPLLATLHGKTTSIPPLWFMRQAGRYLPEYRKVRNNAGSFLEVCYTPKLAAEVTLQPIRRFKLDAAILFSDILVVPDALGLSVAFKEGEGPVLDKISTESDLHTLHLSTIETYLSPVYEAIGLIKAELPQKTALIGFAGSPWTVATYMIEGKSNRDFILSKTMAYSNPQLLEKLIQIIIEATIIHLDAQIKAGVEVIQLFDSWSGILTEDYFKKWIIEPTRIIVERIHALHPSIPIIGFPKGASLHYKDYVKDTKIDAVSIDQYLPLSWVSENIPLNIPLQGCLDPVLLLGKKEPLKERILQIKQEFCNRPFIFNLGHGILPQTPIENVEFMIETVRSV